MTDTALLALSTEIKNETTVGANTKTRIGTILDGIINDKINNDKISSNMTTDTGSTTKVPSVAAVETAIASKGVTTVKVSLTSAEILALNATPKTLIAAPGAGKIIVPLAVTFKFTYGTAAYTTNLNLRVRMGFTLTQNAGVLGLTGNAYSLQPLAGGVQSSDVSNTAVTLDVATGNPSAGDGTLIVYISYIVVSL